MSDSSKIERDVRVTTADGTELSTDVHHPEGGGPFPTVLLRTCYGKELLAPFTGVPELVAAGYRVVMQDCRGSGASTGEPDFFAEAGDGRATGDWIAGQPWFDGRLGTFGGSYMGFTQWAFASTAPPYLRAMSVGLFGAERRAAWYPGGSFALDIAIPWTAVRIHGLEAAGADMQAAIDAAFAHLPLEEADVVATGRTAPWFQDWLVHDAPSDPYWSPLDFTPALSLGIPVLMLDGWYDYQLPNMTRDLAILREHGTPVRFVVGPWTHAGMDSTVTTAETIRWFDRHLRGDASVDTASAARVFVMPDAGWRELGAWPPGGESEAWWLGAGGALSPVGAIAGLASTFTYDASDPTPSVGGPSLRLDAAGPVDNRALEARDDVLTFTSPVLEDPVEVVGDVRVDLTMSADVDHFDVFVRVCDVHPDGASINVCDGIRRFGPPDLARADDGTFPVTVPLWPTAQRFAPGHRIRLQVSGGAHPMFARNLCSGEPLGSARTIVPAHLAVHHDHEHRSVLVLDRTPG